MKVIAVDNFDRESPSFPDRLIKENLSQEEAEILAEELNKGIHCSSNYYHIVVEDSRELWKFYP